MCFYTLFILASPSTSQEHRCNELAWCVSLDISTFTCFLSRYYFLTCLPLYNSLSLLLSLLLLLVCAHKRYDVSWLFDNSLMIKYNNTLCASLFNTQIFLATVTLFLFSVFLASQQLTTASCLVSSTGYLAASSSTDTCYCWRWSYMYKWLKKKFACLLHWQMLMMKADGTFTRVCQFSWTNWW